MKRGLVKFFASIGALIGAAFAVLPILQYYGVYDFAAAIKESDYAVYFLIAAAVCFVVAEALAIFSRLPGRTKDGTRADSRRDADVAADESAAAPMPTPEPYSAPAATLPDPQFDLPPAPSSLQSPKTADFSVPSAPSVSRPAVSAPPKDTEFVSDWNELSQLIDSAELDDVVYSGGRESDLLDLDDEFVVESTDEAVVSAKKPEPDPGCADAPKPERGDKDVDYIIGKINEIIDMVSVREGKK